MTLTNQALEIRSKLPDVGTTIFTVMSQLAVEKVRDYLGKVERPL